MLFDLSSREFPFPWYFKEPYFTSCSTGESQVPSSHCCPQKALFLLSLRCSSSNYLSADVLGPLSCTLITRQEYGHASIIP